MIVDHPAFIVALESQREELPGLVPAVQTELALLASERIAVRIGRKLTQGHDRPATH